MSHRVWGRRPVVEALKAKPEFIKRLWMAKGAEGDAFDEAGRLARKAGIPIMTAERMELTRYAGNPNHQGVVAELSAPISSAEDPIRLVREAKERGEIPFLLLLDQIQDPQNLGALLRTALAAGVHGVVLLKDRAASVTPVVMKTSAGAAAHVAICPVANLANTMEQLKKEGVWIVGSTADPLRQGSSEASASVAYTDFDWKRPLALVVGQEGEGMRKLVMERCDDLVRIPMKGPMASLNVSVATGILLFEVLRKRASAG